MKVFILRDVLCDYSCGCIIVSAKNKKEAIKIIKDKRAEKGISGDLANIYNIEDYIEEIGKGYYFELYGGA